MCKKASKYLGVETAMKLKLGYLLILLGTVLVFISHKILKRNVKTKKDDDIVAHYLEMAYNLPEFLYLAVAGIISFLVGTVMLVLA